MTHGSKVDVMIGRRELKKVVVKPIKEKKRKREEERERRQNREEAKGRNRLRDKMWTAWSATSQEGEDTGRQH